MTATRFGSLQPKITLIPSSIKPGESFPRNIRVNVRPSHNWQSHNLGIDQGLQVRGNVDKIAISSRFLTRERFWGTRASRWGANRAHARPHQPWRTVHHRPPHPSEGAREYHLEHRVHSEIRPRSDRGPEIPFRTWSTNTNADPRSQDQLPSLNHGSLSVPTWQGGHLAEPRLSVSQP